MDRRKANPVIFYFIFCSCCLCDVYNGITLFSNAIGLGQSHTYLIDNNYNFINIWAHSAGVVGTSYLLTDRTIIVQLRSDIHYFGNSHGPIGGRFNKIDWDGSILWEFNYHDFNYHPHHDIDPLPNGNILVLCWEKKTAQQAQNLGRVNVMNEMWPLKIVEIEPVGQDSAIIIWEWHIWDHLIQDVDSLLPNYGQISAHPELVDINLGQFTNPNEGDWLHTNSVDYNPILDQIVFSSRHLDEIFIIDHSTTTADAASHTGGNSGMGGDILYRWGSPQNYNRGGGANKMLNDQHGVNWIPENYPGSGHLLIFNNNPLDSTGQDNSLGNSSVIEIITPLNNDGTYDIPIDSSYGPSNYHWVFGGDDSFFSHFQSGAFRLPNGNTFVTVSQEKYLFEIDTSDQIIWEFYFQTESGLDGNTARAQKYKPNYFTFYLGDMNYDYTLDIFDLTIISEMISAGDTFSTNGDMNQDNVIDDVDITLLIAAIMNQ